LAKPVISGFTPTFGLAGTTVTITGTNLAHATKVAFAGTAASITSDTATRIVTKVPAKAKSGRLTVTTSAGTATSAKPFTVAADPDDNISPGSTAVTATIGGGTGEFYLSGNITVGAQSGTLVITCPSGGYGFTTPASGLGPVNLSAPPTFSSCSDNAGGTDTVTTSGTYTITFVDAAKDEASESPGPPYGDNINLGMPMAGITITTTIIPGCTLTLAPTGPVSLPGPYDDNGTLYTDNPGVAIAGNSTCTPTSPWGLIIRPTTLSPAIKDLS
jgi:hypothetical protein